MDFPQALRAAAEALLIGTLVGAEREASREEQELHPGVRDFMLIALVGAICGMLQNPWLTVAALIATAGLLGVFHLRAPGRSGITTEMAAVLTFCLGMLTATPGVTFGPTLAVGLTVVVTILLEAKRSIHRFIRETITEAEFNDTLRFLAVIFVIYPVLPEGHYGPYGFFDPRQVWMFVILVSSVSYTGYFLEKFLGARVGLRITALLGGLASTTAATASLARSTAEQPELISWYRQAVVMANAVQFPRVLAILWAVSPEAARAGLGPLVAMTAAGLLYALLLARPHKPDLVHPGIGVKNPFRLLPALKFGAVFTAVLFVSAAAAGMSHAGVLATNAVGGLLNADASVLSATELLGHGVLAPGMAQAAILIALLANAVLKAAIAGYMAGAKLARTLVLSFAAMFGAGAAAWALLAW